MREFFVAAGIISAILLCGCNKKTESAKSDSGKANTATHHKEKEEGSSDPSSSSPNSSAAPAEAQEAVDKSASPDHVVMAFLEATRNGDDQLAAKLLSKKALEATTRAGLIVKPPGTPTMQYEIGEVEYPEQHPDGAYVKSIWRERFDDGEDRFDVTWVLRKQPEGWRIVGMAMALPGSEEPDLVNFEAADELRQKIQDANGDSESATADAAEETDAAPQKNTEEKDHTADRLSTKRRNLR